MSSKVKICETCGGRQPDPYIETLEKALSSVGHWWRYDHKKGDPLPAALFERVYRLTRRAAR